VKKVGKPGEVETASGTLKCILPDGAVAGEQVVIMVRPEDVRLFAGPASQSDNVLQGKVEALIFMGDTLECQVAVGGKVMRIKLHPANTVTRGQTVRLELPPACCRALRG
jgi:ABC-type Fe3+/spermidine/putrescine transport system ATPase subunit